MSFYTATYCISNLAFFRSHRCFEFDFFGKGRPDDACLRIDSCDSTCDNCRLNVTSSGGSGELKCHITGSRPRIDLQWVVTNQSGISFIHHEQVEHYDEVSGTFSATRTVSYTADDCGGTASLHCNASVSEYSFGSLVNVRNRNVQIFSGIFHMFISFIQFSFFLI